MPTVTFYSDPHPETTSVDGYVERTGNTSWADTRDGAGTFADDTGIATLRAEISSTNGSFATYIARSLLLFDTSSLPNNAVITQASLNLFRNLSGQTPGGGQSVVVCGCTPASDTDIIPADYGQFGSTAFSVPVSLGDLLPNQYHSFALNASGIAAISLTGITKLGLRMNADLIDSDPTNYIGSNFFWAKSREAGGLTQGPYLAVTYSVPGQVSRFAVGGSFTRQPNVGTFGKISI